MAEKCIAFKKNGKKCNYKAKYGSYCGIHKSKDELKEESRYYLREHKSNGSKCSINGKKYELLVYSVVSKLKNEENGMIFNTQKESELGGCSRRKDIECNFREQGDIGIEIKKKITPDWGQCVLKFNSTTEEWKASESKSSNETKNIFNVLIQDITHKIFNGKIPPFCTRSLTHKEWIKIKSETTDFNDQYFDCPSTTIADIYKLKGCSYIQISEMGLYHFGEDYCNFDVPMFLCSQKIRIRTKIHARKNSKGFCTLSVTMSISPKNIKELEFSKYSLDNLDNVSCNLVRICSYETKEETKMKEENCIPSAGIIWSGTRSGPIWSGTRSGQALPDP